MSDTAAPALGRFTLLAGIPVFLVLDLWMMLGPGLYGESGWGAVFVLFLFTPSLLVWLGIVFGLGLTHPRRPRAFTTGQTVMTWLLWGVMAVIGATFADAGDNGGGVSVLMHLFGEDASDLSGSLFGLACFLGLLGGFALPVMVLVDRANAARDDSAAAGPGSVHTPER